MKFDFGYDYESPTLECSKEQSKHAAVIAPARRRFEDRARCIDREHGLFNRKSAFTGTLFDMRSVVKFIRHCALPDTRHAGWVTAPAFAPPSHASRSESTP